MKSRRPAEAAPSARGPRPSKAIEAAIEKSRCRSVKMECGHFTDQDIQLLYAVFRLLPKDLYCERCDDWYPVKLTRRKPAPAENTPLF